LFLTIGILFFDIILKTQTLVIKTLGGMFIAQNGVQGLVALAVSGVIGIYIVLQFTPLLNEAGAVIIVLTGLFGILIAYAVIRVFL
jgi:hypothetical protein